MFSTVQALPVDPLLGLTKLFNDDPRDEKLDLGVGVYRTPEGTTPVMQAIQDSQQQCVASESTKSYVSPEGAPGFNAAILELLFGSDHAANGEGRCLSVQTPGGCGALRVAGELLKSRGAKTIYVGDPTWPNHKPLLEAAGISVATIPFYDQSRSELQFDAFMRHIETLGQNDVLLLHGCCHNPTGADLNRQQIDAVIDACEKQRFLPFVDMAYHGFAQGLEEDAYMVREMARRLPEVLVAYSCSKNFALYRERVGALMVVAENEYLAQAVGSHILSIARGIYSMPPAHGGILVADVLSTDRHQDWRDELADMNKNIAKNRSLLCESAKARGFGEELAFISQQFGMFSLLPMSSNDVIAMREQYGIYMAESGRINLCGLNARNVHYLCDAYQAVVLA